MTEKPSKTVIVNNGQTKVTLIGRWFFTDPEEIESECQKGIESGDPFFRNINNALCSVHDSGHHTN